MLNQIFVALHLNWIKIIKKKEENVIEKKRLRCYKAKVPHHKQLHKLNWDLETKQRSEGDKKMEVRGSRKLCKKQKSLNEENKTTTKIQSIHSAQTLS